MSALASKTDETVSLCDAPLRATLDSREGEFAAWLIRFGTAGRPVDVGEGLASPEKGGD